MIKLSYPQPEFRMKRENGKELIFDAFRRQWVIITPEEWVRQNFLQVLVRQLRYPPALVAVEKEIKLGSLKKRFDILVYDKEHRPWMLVECKSQQVVLDDTVVSQVLRYHAGLPVNYLAITNGDYCQAWLKSESGFVPVTELPVHPDPVQ